MEKKWKPNNIKKCNKKNYLMKNETNKKKKS